MMILFFMLKTIFILFIIILTNACITLGQAPGVKQDSSAIRESQIRKQLERKQILNIETYKENRAIAQQKKRLQNLRRYCDKIDAFFERGLDTSRIHRKTETFEKVYNLATSSILKDDDFSSYRDLNAAELLLGELLTQVTLERKKIYLNLRSIERMQLELDSMVMDSAIYVLPSDSIRQQHTIHSLTNINRKVEPMDSLLRISGYEVMEIAARLNSLVGRIESSINVLGTKRNVLTSSFTKKETPYLWQPIEKERSISLIILSSFQRAKSVLHYFFKNNLSVVEVLIFLYVGVTAFAFWIIRKIKKDKKPVSGYLNNVVFSNAPLGILLLVLNIGQFFFITPPFVFQVVIWLASAVILIFLIFQKVEFVSNKILSTLLIFISPVVFINLVLEPSTMERWFIFVFAAVGIPIAFYLWKFKDEYRMSLFLFKVLIVIFVVCNFASMFSIVFGRYNLSKTLLAAGYFTLVSAMLLVWTEVILNQFILLIVDAFDTLEQRDIHSKVVQFQKTVKSWTNFLVYLGIIMLFLRNFYLYNLLTNAFGEFMIQERFIGNMSFSFYDIAVFIFVIVVSSWISSLVAFLFDDTELIADKKRGKGGLKNWALLIRLSIIVFGFFLAFAAARIPMDKLTIILGAVGVGIGFGLQNIMNNLFSGIILAFERPIEIGDQIEVGGRVGRVHTIGIRSSKLQNLDGSEVIIPNGDLISQQVVNWTLSNNHRRVELLVGVEYGTDLAKVKHLLEDILLGNERVEKFPASLVLLHDFGDSAIMFRLLFWSDVRFWTEVKSEIILAIDLKFREKGIKIPFPQMDLRLTQDQNEVIPIKVVSKKEVPKDN
jgi:potassium-dependent mechanosensitive channel